MVRTLRALVALLVVSSLSAAGQVAGAADLQRVAVINTPSDAGGEVYYAQDRGIFKKYGLDVTITNLTSGAAVAAAMSSGQYDIAQGNIASVAAAREAGLPFVFIAPAALYSDANPTTVLVVQKDSPIKTAADLAGKTVANVSLNDIGTVALNLWLTKQHVEPAQVHVIEMPLSSMGGALERGTVAAAVMFEPFLSAELAQNGRMLGKIYTAISPRFLISGYYGRSDWVASHPEAVRAFEKALAEAGRWANANRPASAEILARATNVKITPNQTRVEYSITLNAALLQPLIDAAATAKMLKAPIAADSLISR